MCETHSRGKFLGGIAMTAASFVAGSVLLPSFALADVPDPFTTRELWLHSPHTGETIKAAFTIDGRNIYKPGYFAICDLLRDPHVSKAQGEVLIDIRTIEALFETQQVLALAGMHGPIEVYSGYRTAGTNAQVEGARYSYHMRAQAVDFSVPNAPLEYVWKVCNSRSITGGLGYYPGSHIHIDCGPRRYW